MEQEPPLDPYDLYELYCRAPELAHEYVLEQYTNLIKKYVKFYLPRCTSLDWDDLFSYGYLGLHQALETFDPERSSFTNWAVWNIRGVIMKGIADTDLLVRLPQEIVDIGKRLKRSADVLAQNLGRPPSVEELSQATGVRPYVIIAQTINPVTLFGPEKDVSNWGQACIVWSGERFIAPSVEPQALDHVSVSMIVDTIHTLSPRYQAPLLFFCYKPEGYIKDLALQLKVSNDGARLRLGTAVKHLRLALQNKGYHL